MQTEIELPEWAQKLIREQEHTIKYLNAVMAGDTISIIQLSGHAHWVKPGDRVLCKHQKSKQGTVNAVCVSDKYTSPCWYPDPFVVVRWDEYAKEFDDNCNNDRLKHEISLSDIVVISDRRTVADRRVKKVGRRK